MRIQEVVVQESYAHYSQFLVNSEFEVRMRLDRQRDVLHELEADAEAHKGRATVAEERYLQTEMDATRLLHTERDALHYAATEHGQARHHAHQMVAFAGLTDELQNKLEQTQKIAVYELTEIVTQGTSRSTPGRISPGRSTESLPLRPTGSGKSATSSGKFGSFFSRRRMFPGPLLSERLGSLSHGGRGPHLRCYYGLHGKAPQLPDY